MLLDIQAVILLVIYIKMFINLVKRYSMIPSDNYIDISSIVPIDNNVYS